MKGSERCSEGLAADGLTTAGRLPDLISPTSESSTEQRRPRPQQQLRAQLRKMAAAAAQNVAAALTRQTTVAAAATPFSADAFQETPLLSRRTHTLLSFARKTRVLRALKIFARVPPTSGVARTVFDVAVCARKQTRPLCPFPNGDEGIRAKRIVGPRTGAF